MHHLIKICPVVHRLTYYTQYVFAYCARSYKQVKDKNAFGVLATTWVFKENFIVEFFHFMRNVTL
jgi:hypothetical protein